MKKLITIKTIEIKKRKIVEENKEITKPIVTFAKPSFTLPLRRVGIIINDKMSKDMTGLNDII